MQKPFLLFLRSCLNRSFDRTDLGTSATGNAQVLFDHIRISGNDGLHRASVNAETAGYTGIRDPIALGEQLLWFFSLFSKKTSPLDYSSTGAPTGQTPAQAPQPMQVSASITYLPSPAEIADTGHSASQAPQEMQSAVILYAIVKILLQIW